MCSSIEKWQELLNHYKIEGEIAPVISEVLNEFESQVGILLPSQYKEFCQTFGSGMFAKTEFYIDCPSIEKLDILLMSDTEMIGACKNAYKNYGSPVRIMELLDSAYVFGSGQGYVLFFFDLKTYNEEDESYDIWGVGEPSSRDLAIYNLGRNFYQFIYDICLDWSMEKSYPEIFVGISENSRIKYQKRQTTFIAVT